MINKGTIEAVANLIAETRFEEWCRYLDVKIFDQLDKAWDGEFISKERKDRIRKAFYENMTNTK